jgi:hypothetical protein
MASIPLPSLNQNGLYQPAHSAEANRISMRLNARGLSDVSRNQPHRLCNIPEPPLYPSSTIRKTASVAGGSCSAFNQSTRALRLDQVVVVQKRYARGEMQLLPTQLHRIHNNQLLMEENDREGKEHLTRQ